MQQLITDNNQVVLLAGPEKEGAKYPTKEEIAALLKQMKSFDLKPYEDKVSNEPLISEDIKGGKIVSEKAGEIYGTTKLVLSNGVTVYVKPTDFKADQIVMKGVSFGGTSVFPNEEIINISQLNGVALVGGIGNFSKVDLGKALAGKRANVGAGIGNTTETVSGSCAPKDFETMMQLTYLTFTSPRKDNEAFESYKNRLKAELQNADANPMTAFSDTITSVLYGHHPRCYQNESKTLVDQINYDRILEVQRPLQRCKCFHFLPGRKRRLGYNETVNLPNIWEVCHLSTVKRLSKITRWTSARERSKMYLRKHRKLRWLPSCSFIAALANMTCATMSCLAS